MATGGSAASSEWRPKATKVPQRVCSCSGYVHTHATTAALKCQLEVQLCAKNRLPPRGKKAHRFDMEAKGKKESASKWGVRIRWHEGSIKRGKFSPRSEEETPNEWRHSVAFLPPMKYEPWRKNSFSHQMGWSEVRRTTRCVEITDIDWNLYPMFGEKCEFKYIIYYKFLRKCCVIGNLKKKKKGKNENENWRELFLS